MWTSLVLLFGVFLSVSSSSLPLPPYVKACKRNSPDLDACALENGKLALPYILKGDRKYGIPSFLPLKIKEIGIETAGNLVLNLKDVEAFGLDKTILKKIKIDSAAEQIFLEFALEKLTILSKYDIDGKILVLPINGHGDCNITATGGEFKYDFKYKDVLKDGEEYLSVVEDHLDFTVTGLHVNFENLFNGDHMLGDNTNKVLNQEWRAVLKDVKPAIEKAVSAVASSLINNIFGKVAHKLVLPID